MGDAMAAAAHGPEAVYWNPAALGLARRPALASGFSLLSLGRRQTHAAMLLAWDPAGRAPAAGAFPGAHRTGLAGWGLGWMGFSLGDDFEGRRADTVEHYLFSDRQTAYLIGHGRPVLDWLALGVGLRVYERALENFSASGSGLDLGALLLLGPRLRIGVSSSEHAARLRWSTGYEERLPVVVRSAVNLKALAKLQVAAQATAVESGPVEAGLGLEWELWPGLVVRSGWKAESLRAGAGWQVPLRVWELQLDYAYLQDPLQWGDSQRFELGICF